jgi:hypothetical protein
MMVSRLLGGKCVKRTARIVSLTLLIGTAAGAVVTSPSGVQAGPKTSGGVGGGGSEVPEGAKPAIIYAIDSGGKLFWYRHNGMVNGANEWAKPRELGTGWNEYKHVHGGWVWSELLSDRREIFSGAKPRYATFGMIFNIEPDGTRRLRGDQGYLDGQQPWKAWIHGGGESHTWQLWDWDWGKVRQVFTGDWGHEYRATYAIMEDGELRERLHFPVHTKKDSTFTKVGTGWNGFKHVFFGGRNILYTISPDGTLRWHKHLGYRTGEFKWAQGRDVGTGWGNYKHVFSPGNGIIYTVTQDHKLLWHRHKGYSDIGVDSWEGPKLVGIGWNFAQVFSLVDSELSELSASGRPIKKLGKRVLVAGAWQIKAAGGNQDTLNLTQEGISVLGTYSPGEGTLEGTMEGKVLSFKWKQKDGSKGAGKFTFAPDLRSFNGTWGATDNPDDASKGAWNGVRK